MQANGVAASCSGVVKIYWSRTAEVHALRGIDALFSRGAITSVVGPSGSGKSSLLRILAGMDLPTAGSVVIGEREISSLPPRRLAGVRRGLVGYVFQRPADNLISDLTVEEHLELARALRRSRVQSPAEILDMLGIQHRKRHRPSELSGGEQQRVAFAQAIVGNPVLVIADEPTAELDSGSAESLMQMVREFASGGHAFVIATHDPVVAEASHAILALRHGAIETETKEARALSVIDAAGRIQLPPEILRMFPDRRALLEIIEEGEVRVRRP